LEVHDVGSGEPEVKQTCEYYYLDPSLLDKLGELEGRLRNLVEAATQCSEYGQGVYV
jgi:hypothetical protein